MPFLYAALYVFRWGFLAAGVFSLLAALFFVTVANPTDVEKAVQLVISAGILIGCSFIGRVILEREH